MERYRVKPGSKVKLADHDTDETSGFDGPKEEGERKAATLTERLELLQELMHAEGRRRLLVVLQGMDTGGKDGVIRHVFEGVNPRGVKVASFGVPTPLELAHDYLWRIHPHMPASGEIAIFNRSHYEDVLVVRVKDLAPKDVWSRRYDHIKVFEEMLADEGTTILKFFLHISKDEQRRRLQERLDEPAKRWKFRSGDLADRALWDAYEEAYEDVLSRTSTDKAPWYIVPADKKWYRNLVIGDVLVRALEGFDMHNPPGEPGLDKVVVR